MIISAAPGGFDARSDKRDPDPWRCKVEKPYTKNKATQYIKNITNINTKIALTSKVPKAPGPHSEVVV